MVDSRPTFCRPTHRRPTVEGLHETRLSSHDENLLVQPQSSDDRRAHETGPRGVGRFTSITANVDFDTDLLLTSLDASNSCLTKFY